MQALNRNYSVKIQLLDIELDEEFAHVNPQKTEVFFGLDKQVFQSIPFNSKNKETLLPLSGGSERVVIELKTLDRDHDLIGTIGIPQDIIFAGGEQLYEQWITLFDHPDDNEYDGEMGLNDEECPRLLIQFKLVSELQKKPREGKDRRKRNHQHSVSQS